jgi:peptidoglycan LD-endopeptidase LytH
MSTPRTLLTVIVLGALLGMAVYIYLQFRSSSASVRSAFVWAYLRDPASHADLAIKAGTRCGDAPFIFPTTGVAGYLWDDSFGAGHRHQGVDIFAGTDGGVTEVVAAYPGYLTRLLEWKSSVIVRVPADPLEPSRQIWVYYTHLADRDGKSFISSEFPPGTREKPVRAGTFLGYQGNYSGDPARPVGVHLHISVARDDGSGHFENELDINNTYDPSPYLGLRLNARENTDQIPVCESKEED